MEITEARASRYRRTAAGLRQQADALDSTRERAELLAIADQYDRLADRVGRSKGGVVWTPEKEIAGRGP
jgi:hypothetical protein